MFKSANLLILLLFLISLGNQNSFAQFMEGVGQEIGAVAGPVAFLSDYGERNSYRTNAGNTGIGFGLVHYLNFTYSKNCQCYVAKDYFRDHFKIRTEIDYHRTELNHYGEVAYPKGEVDETALENARKLQAMSSIAALFEMGAHLEYYPLSVYKFSVFTTPFAPFVSLGANYVHFSSHTSSSLGSLQDPANLYWKFQNGVDLKGEGGSTWALAAGAGSRFKMSHAADLLVNVQWRYYASDWIDGLNHDRPENKAKDMIFWLSLGYIHYLNY